LHLKPELIRLFGCNFPKELLLNRPNVLLN
jgi:hypothetical protein